MDKNRNSDLVLEIKYLFLLDDSILFYVLFYIPVKGIKKPIRLEKVYPKPRTI